MHPKFLELLKLPPEVRIRALRQLEDHLRKLILRHKKAINIDEKEIREAEEMLQKAIQELRILEEQENLSSKLAKKPEKKETNESKSLEEELADIKLTPQQELTATLQAQKPLQEAYNELKKLYETTPKVEQMNDYQRNKFYEAIGAIEHRLEDAKKGIRPLDEKESLMMNTAEKIIKYEREDRDKTKSFYQN